MESANSVQYILAIVFVAVVGVFGAGVMFVRGSNIERNFLVGGLTLFTAFLAGVMLVSMPSAAQTSGSLMSISLVSVLGFVVGRILDLILGPRDEVENVVGGADLSD